ncbi:MAG TPA: hypothetical protein VF744_05185 [Beijerinckiaceae bacterium]|jgi:hypothetical protein
MTSLLKGTAVALAAAFALTAFEVPGEARERSGVTQTRHVKKTRTHRRVAQRTMPYAAAAVPAAAYAAPHPMAPYGGPGRAQFEPLIPGAPPERGDNHSPEGP